MRFVDLEQARSASGVRLVVVGSIPSPWSEAAKGILVVKGIDAVLVRFSPNDEAVKQWTGWHNAPVLMVNGDPPRTHWSEILETAERLDGRVSLLPVDSGERIRMFGYSHELLGEGGLVWSARLLAIHRGLMTGGREGFPLRLAHYLAPKYGYAPERAEAAGARVLSVLGLLGELAQSSRARCHEYLLGSELTALDLYAATALGPIAPLPQEQCPGMHPAMRRAFETAFPDARAAVPAILCEHRDMVYRRHLGLPVEL
jgi:glutathione S-transferase